jgi:hypothetical protein
LRELEGVDEDRREGDSDIDGSDDGSIVKFGDGSEDGFAESGIFMVVIKDGVEDSKVEGDEEL